MGHAYPAAAKLDVGNLAIIAASTCFDLLLEHTSAIIGISVDIVCRPLRENLDDARTPDITAVQNLLY